MNSLSWTCVGVREVGNEFKFEVSSSLNHN